MVKNVDKIIYNALNYSPNRYRKMYCILKKFYSFSKHKIFKRSSHETKQLLIKHEELLMYLNEYIKIYTIQSFQLSHKKKTFTISQGYILNSNKL